MKKNIFITLLALTLSSYCFSQQIANYKKEINRSEDSTLVRMVKGINDLIRERARLTAPPHVSAIWYDYVTIVGEATVPIDSLYGRYHIKDFKNITISFDEPPAIDGIKAHLGVIKLYRKDKQLNKNKTNK